MSDILTSLWLNIDSFNYRDKSIIVVSNDDIELLKTARKNFILKPAICLLFTFIVSKYRFRIWEKTKNYFVKNRIKNNSLNNSAVKFDINQISSKEIKIEYFSNDNYDDINKIAISNSRKISSKRKILNGTNNEETMNLPRTEPTVSEEYLSFTDKYKTNIRKFVFFKQFVSSEKNTVYNKSEKFLTTSKFIYLPFFFILLISFYELAITYTALYFKYQPLIDQYFETMNNKKNNNK